MGVGRGTRRGGGGAKSRRAVVISCWTTALSAIPPTHAIGLTKNSQYFLYWDAGMAQWLKHSPATNVALDLFLC